MARFAITISLVAVLHGATVRAEVRSESVAYTHGDVALEGFLAWDDAVEGKRPGILVVHEWWGLNEYARRRVRELAGLGYVAFALDMYGKGKVTRHPEKAREWAGQFRRGGKLMGQRAHAGLAVLLGRENVDAKRVAAIGYCFGGSTVLQLAYDGADVAGVVSFHGGLHPAPEGARIRARILVCHGAEDPMVSVDGLSSFKQALRDRGADWQLISYGGAVHSFTNPAADKAGMAAVGYHAAADRRSWGHMRLFFDEVFEEAP